MPPRGSFERRLLVALVLFSVVPSLLLILAGAALLSEVVALHASAAAFERIAESGRELLSAAEASGDPALRAAAAEHREVLSSALIQAGRWEYLNERVLGLIPFVAIGVAAVLSWLAVRAARSIARAMSRPTHELVGWASRIARDQPLPPRGSEELGTDEFAALRDAFRTMAGELAASRARALEAERARTWVTMARSVAHELKNSLTPLRFAVRALESSVRADPAAAEPMEVLTSEAARLEELARAFSQFGRLPEGPPSEVDLREQLEYLARTHLPPHVEPRIESPPDLPHVRGHHEVLSRAFSNLLLNAGEAMGPGGGVVEIRLQADVREVTVTIRDSGPGLPPASAGSIWDPEFTTKARGTGLGLALVRQAIEAHGGSVRAADHPGGGAEFTVKLPILPPDSGATARATAAARSSGGMG